jgi:hypothetical protein
VNYHILPFVGWKRRLRKHSLNECQSKVVYEEDGLKPAKDLDLARASEYRKRSTYGITPKQDVIVYASLMQTFTEYVLAVSSIGLMEIT